MNIWWLRQLWRTLLAVLAYDGDFCRRDVWPFYWDEAGKKLARERWLGIEDHPS